MKRCPSCNRTYADVSLNYCLEDGTPLLGDSPHPVDPNVTVRYPPSRQTDEPPPTEIYRQDKALINQVPEMAQPRPQAQQWSRPSQVHPPKKSNAVWWILGGVAVVGIVGIGLVIMIIALASLGTDANVNTNTRNVNGNSNLSTNSNSTSTSGVSYKDDFSAQRWRTGNFEFGDIWYADDQYHMRAKERMYLVMYAPTDEYSTENATISVTARSLDGTGPTSGYGLIVHGQKSSSNELEDYALLIYTGDEPQYEIVMHKNGNQQTLVPWTKSSALRSGTNTNRLEVRVKGDQLSFYVNGRYLTRITDDENFKRGVAGLYSSEASEVVFDDLEIQR
jgi:hypothetical protein